jgi:hypothetical protein
MSGIAATGMILGTSSVALNTLTPQQYQQGISDLNSYLGNILSTKSSNPSYKFPDDLSDSYYMGFMFSSYKKDFFNEAPSKVWEGGTKLPIPNSLTNDTNVKYNDQNLTSAVTGFIGQIADKYGGGTPEQKQKRDNTLSVVSGAAKALSYSTGVTINPFMTVLFDSPTLKTHTFSWKLTPKNANESRTITNIIKNFQKNMLPSSGGPRGVVLTFPSFVDIFLVAGGSDANLYKFKTCVITDFKANYAPNGPAFFNSSSAPASVDISVSLKEIEMWVSEDIQNFT